ncbi:hypothetical protein RHGRI_007998 [Rhododendron griersonianum]|uniref:AP180 N-terminal homology (ANTH) domain-containing protein n=1 Tax=Rhododendron griersonianum TaxID=479676 RepID=A0AAV6KYS8_9ERIC|nr:hypothetical protein RHGRI_007998 [Rhododendron griersonianum]
MILGFGFRLFVRLEYTKLFDGLPGALDMESTIVIKELDIAIVRATNHVERPVKQKHTKGECSLKMEMACSFDSCPFCASATRPRANVANYIHALARRLSKTHNWAVCVQSNHMPLGKQLS